jgi:hypothetical protein
VVVEETARMAPAETMDDAVGPPPPKTPTRGADVVMDAPVAEPSERAHRALAEVRRWMEEPPRRREADRPRRATPAAGIPEPSLSIGTIEVTVEAAPTPQPVPAVAPTSPPPRRAGRDVVPRDYLRGW